MLGPRKTWTMCVLVFTKVSVWIHKARFKNREQPGGFGTDRYILLVFSLVPVLILKEVPYPVTFFPVFAWLISLAWSITRQDSCSLIKSSLAETSASRLLGLAPHFSSKELSEPLHNPVRTLSPFGKYSKEPLICPLSIVWLNHCFWFSKVNTHCNTQYALSHCIPAPEFAMGLSAQPSLRISALDTFFFVPFCPQKLCFCCFVLFSLSEDRQSSLSLVYLTRRKNIHEDTSLIWLEKLIEPLQDCAVVKLDGSESLLPQGWMHIQSPQWCINWFFDYDKAWAFQTVFRLMAATFGKEPNCTLGSL